MDVCAGTFSAVKAFMLLSKHRKFIACKVNPSCMTEAMAQPFLLYAQHVLGKELNLIGEEEARRSAEAYVKNWKGLRWKRV